MLTKEKETNLKSCFPVSEKAVKLAKAEIRSNPRQQLEAEWENITRQNTRLGEFLKLSHDAIKQSGYENKYTEGALWVYKTIRIQGELSGSLSPVVSQEVIAAYSREIIDQCDGTGKELVDLFTELKSEMEENEPALGRLIKEVTAYEPYPEYYFGGASDVYWLLERASVN
ncbi:hypothetical protein ACFL0Y_00025 [Patescibacteria group bacterium]